jgi:hypothetical protein
MGALRLGRGELCAVAVRLLLQVLAHGVERSLQLGQVRVGNLE